MGILQYNSLPTTNQDWNLYSTNNPQPKSCDDVGVKFLKIKSSTNENKVQQNWTVH